MKRFLLSLFVLVVFSFITVSCDFSDHSYDNLLSGTWFHSKTPSEEYISEKLFSWGSGKIIPNSTYEIDLLGKINTLFIPAIGGPFKITKIEKIENNLTRINFYFDRGNFDASLDLKIISENEIELVKYNKLEIHFYSSQKYFKISGPKIKKD